MTKYSVVYAVAFLVLICALNSLTKISSTLAPDFSVFYDAAHGLLAHRNIYTLPLFTGLGYPPFTLMWVLPFTWLPYPLAQSIWVYLSLATLWLTIYFALVLVRKKVTLIEFCTVFIFAFLAFPTKFTLGMGQVNFAALASLLLSLWFIMRKQSLWAGIALGVLCIIKPHFLLFVPIYMLAGQWVVLAGAFTVLTGSILGTGMLFGWNLYIYYFSTTLPQLLVFAGRDIYYNQGLGSFLSRVLPNTLAGELTHWISWLLIVGAWWFIRQKRLSFIPSVMLYIPVFLLVEPLSWQHHYVFLLPVYVWLAGKIQGGWQLAMYTFSYFLVAINFPSPPGFALSHVFLGNILLLSLVVYETA